MTSVCPSAPSQTNSCRKREAFRLRSPGAGCEQSISTFMSVNKPSETSRQHRYYQNLNCASITAGMTVGKASSREQKLSNPRRRTKTGPARRPGSGDRRPGGCPYRAVGVLPGVGEELLLLLPAPAVPWPPAPAGSVRSGPPTHAQQSSGTLRGDWPFRRCPHFPQPQSLGHFLFPATGPSNQTPSCFKAKENCLA